MEAGKGARRVSMEQITSPVRRRIIAAILLALANGPLFARAFGSAPRISAQPSNVSSDDLRARIWLGEHYLKLHPEERSARRISGALFGNECANICSLNNRSDLQQHVLQQHNQDFQDGDVVVIAGWVLTRTEARVFALSAIESAS
jgi:hypothetical protein